MKQINRGFSLWFFFLFCSSFANAGWVVESEVVDDSADVGVYNSIAVDASGTVHVAYYDADNQNLKYATQDESGSWSNSVVDSSDDVGSYCSLAVDSNGVPHFSYHDSYMQTILGVGTIPRGDLNYVAGAAGMPVTLDNSSALVVGQYTSIVLSTNGEPRVAYYDASDGDLYYIEKTGSSWGTPVNVDSGGKGASLSLSIRWADPISRMYPAQI